MDITVSISGQLTSRQRRALKLLSEDGETAKQTAERLLMHASKSTFDALTSGYVDPVEQELIDTIGELEIPEVRGVLQHAKERLIGALPLLAFAAVSLISIGGRAATAQDFPAMPERPMLKAFQSTGIITAGDRAGTGWVVKTTDSQKIIVTNAHVIGSAKHASIKFCHVPGCPVRNCTVTYKTPRLKLVPTPGDEDIAILRCDSLPSQSTGFRIASFPLSIKGQLYTVGSPNASGPTMLPIQRFRASNLSWSPPALEGRSGSPVFYNGQSDPVAVCTLFCTSPSDSFGTSLEPVLKRCATAFQETGIRDKIRDVMPQPEINVNPTIGLTFGQLFLAVFLGQIITALLWPMGRFLMWIVKTATLEAARHIEVPQPKDSTPSRRTRKVVPKRKRE